MNASDFLFFVIYFGVPEIFKIYFETVSIKCSLIFLKAVNAIIRESPKAENTRLNGFSRAFGNFLKSPIGFQKPFSKGSGGFRKLFFDCINGF